MSVYIKLVCEAMTDSKLLAAGPDGFTLYVKGLLYAKLHMTDGVVPDHALPLIDVGLKRVSKTISRLTALNLWTRIDGGFTVGEDRWARYQTTKAQVDQQREETRRRVAEYRARKCNAVTPTPCNADVTPPEHRAQSTEHRVKEKQTPPNPPLAEGGDDVSESPKPSRTGGKPEPAVAPEALAVAERWAKLVARHDGPKFQTPTIRKFAAAVFGPMLAEFGAADLDAVLAWLDTDAAAQAWEFGLRNAPKGYEHALKRNFGSLLAKARRAGFDGKPPVRWVPVTPSLEVPVYDPPKRKLGPNEIEIDEHGNVVDWGCE